MGTRRLILAGISAALWVAAAQPAAAAESTAFGFTGTEQTFTVPAGVRSVHVVAIGARGGRGSNSTFNTGGPGGFGGRVEADLEVQPGNVLFIEVGGNGGDGGVGKAGAGGFNGGGASGGAIGGGGGGGGTDVRGCAAGGPVCSGAFPNTLMSRLLVAGGGGGGGALGSGQVGSGGEGGNAGQDGSLGQAANCNPGTTAGGGGHPGSEHFGGQGGAGGSNGASAGGAGQFGIGGVATIGLFDLDGGGGGGGGYFGGGAGGSGSNCPGGGGGGGSSYAGSRTTNASFAADLTGVAGVVITVPDPKVTPPPPKPTPQPPAPTPPSPKKPSSAFRLGGLTLDKRKGTGMLAADLPGAGMLSLSGKGLVAKRVPVGAAGTAKLTIKASGRAGRTFSRTGKLKLTARVTFTPAGGDPSTQTRAIKLVRART